MIMNPLRRQQPDLLDPAGLATDRLDAAAPRPTGLIRRIFARPGSIVAGATFAAIVMIGVVGHFVTPYDPDKVALDNMLQPPSAQHWLGTDDLGRDVFSRLLDATAVDLLAAFEAVAIALVAGVLLGVLAGSALGIVDGVLSRIIDALMALPPLILAVVVVGTLGPGLTGAMIAIGIVLVPGIYRLARASTMVARSELYVEAARASGASRLRVATTHVGPSLVGPLAVQATFAASGAIIAEASLTFLGLGARPPQATWGSMLKDAAQQIYESPYLIFPPMVLIIVTILSLSVLGDALRDAVGADRTGTVGGAH